MKKIRLKIWFQPYGVEIPPYNETAQNTHKFTGHERDAETGFDYMHFRYYGSNIARFLKPDNIIPDITNPQNWNAYTYVKGNPVNFNDPSGHFDFGDDVALEAQYKAVKQYILKSAVGTKILNKGEKDTSLKVVKTSGDTHYSKKEHTIYWNPTQGIDIGKKGGKADSKGGTIISPAVGFVHETAHAINFKEDYDAAQKRQNTKDENYGNKEEAKVISEVEVPVCRDLDEPIRETNQYSEGITTTSPTSNVAVEKEPPAVSPESIKETAK